MRNSSGNHERNCSGIGTGGRYRCPRRHIPTRSSARCRRMFFDKHRIWSIACRNDRDQTINVDQVRVHDQNYSTHVRKSHSFKLKRLQPLSQDNNYMRGFARARRGPFVTAKVPKTISARARPYGSLRLRPVRKREDPPETNQIFKLGMGRANPTKTQSSYLPPLPDPTS